MRKLAAITVVIVTLTTTSVCQRGKSATLSAGSLADYCSTYLTAFAPENTAKDYKDKKELIESTRCFNYVSAVMDESAGAHWDISTGMSAPVVRAWQWQATAQEVIKAFVEWTAAHPDRVSGYYPANAAIKEAAVAKKMYVYSDNE